MRQLATRYCGFLLLLALVAGCTHVTPTQRGVLARPVRWSRCMSALRGMNPAVLFEVGPGRVLSGLARANGFGATPRILNVSNLRGVELAVRTLGVPSTEPCPGRPPLLASGS